MKFITTTVAALAVVTTLGWLLLGGELGSVVETSLSRTRTGMGSNLSHEFRADQAELQLGAADQEIGEQEKRVAELRVHCRELASEVEDLEAGLELTLRSEQLLDAPQRTLEERPARARLLGVPVGLPLLGVAHFGQGVGQLLLCRAQLPLHGALRLLDQLTLALLELRRGLGLTLDLVDLLVERFDRLAREQDVEQPFEVVDHLALLAQRLGERRRLDVLPDAGDVAEDPGALEVGEAGRQIVHLLLLALALVADLEPRHQLLQPLRLTQDLVLVTAQPLDGGFVELLGRDGRRKREDQRGRGRGGAGSGRYESHHLPRASSVRFWRSRWRSRSARTSCTRSW